jgi:uncharacterized protein YdhG (YjbR/CyaY superfamily)
VAKPATIDAYLAGLAPDRREAVEAIRRTVTAAAPDATETISYDMPALRLGRRFLVSYAAFKHHYSLFPASDVVVATIGADIEPYLAGRGTIRFPAGKPVPMDIVRRVVEVRVDELRGGGA